MPSWEEWWCRAEVDNRLHDDKPGKMHLRKLGKRNQVVVLDILLDRPEYFPQGVHLVRLDWSDYVEGLLVGHTVPIEGFSLLQNGDLSAWKPI
jgi:hypothetical protein